MRTGEGLVMVNSVPDRMDMRAAETWSPLAAHRPCGPLSLVRTAPDGLLCGSATLPRRRPELRLLPQPASGWHAAGRRHAGTRRAFRHCVGNASGSLPLDSMCRYDAAASSASSVHLGYLFP
jgi:hypothetical protein